MSKFPGGVPAGVSLGKGRLLPSAQPAFALRLIVRQHFDFYKRVCYSIPSFRVNIDRKQFKTKRQREEGRKWEHEYD